MRASTSVPFVFLASVLLAGLGACSLVVGGITPEDGAGGSGNAGGSGGSGGSGNTGGSGGGSGGGSAACEPPAVDCTDQVLQQMNLLNDQVTPGLITSAADGAGWLSTIDATAGGPFASNPDSYTYGRFTDTGLEKVELADDASLDSMDWDIAFRRYVIRINSGNSGPSCVIATPIPGDPPYDDVTAVPDPLPQYRTDEYFDAGCVLIPDGQGLEGAPGTALAGYYSYQTCVSMTDRVYIVQLADGRHLKLTVTDYYEPSVQEQCDTTGVIPMMNTGSANFRVRWAFLP